MEGDPSKSADLGHFQELPENHWFEVVSRLYAESGEVPDPLQIRAAAIMSALELPLGESTALEFHKGQKRTDQEVERDKVIAQYLTNKAGVVIDEKRGIVSTDFRDLYPKGLPEELTHALDEDTRAVMEIEYEHAQAIKDRFGDTNDPNEADCSVHYFRLPGGVDLFLRGYIHNNLWQENHKKFLAEVNKHTRVICIEGGVDAPFGDSMEIYWSERRGQQGHFDALMHQAVEAGFNGLFTEVDARDETKIKMDGTDWMCGAKISPRNLPDEFFEKYFAFLAREHPHLADMLVWPDGLRKCLEAQSNTNFGLLDRSTENVFQRGKLYGNRPWFKSFTLDGETSSEPRFFELGQQWFTDALAAIKLHLVAKLMTDGHLPKGLIVDYEGAIHLSSKSFFLRYPYYAMEVVLRTVNELMAGRAEEKRWFLKLFRKGNINEIYKVFDNPNWSEIVKEIVRLHFKQPEDDPSKTTTPGPNQRKLIDYPIDVLKIYDINPATVVPTDEQIKVIQQKLTAS